MKKGDQVRIVKYGSLIWCPKREWDEMYTSGAVNSKVPNDLLDTVERLGEILYCYDVRPELVGDTGIIRRISIVQGKPNYALEGPIKVAWYNEDQLELL